MPAACLLRAASLLTPGASPPVARACAGILSYEADPNIVDEVSGMSPLLYGVASGCVPVTIALLRNGACECEEFRHLFAHARTMMEPLY